MPTSTHCPKLLSFDMVSSVIARDRMYTQNPSSWFSSYWSHLSLFFFFRPIQTLTGSLGSQDWIILCRAAMGRVECRGASSVLYILGILAFLAAILEIPASAPSYFQCNNQRYLQMLLDFQKEGKIAPVMSYCPEHSFLPSPKASSCLTLRPRL